MFQAVAGLFLIGIGGWAYANYVMIGGRNWQRVIAALPFGLVLFTLFLNSALIARISMDLAITVSLFLLSFLGAVGVFRMHPKRGDHFAKWELAYLYLAGLTVLVYAWLWYLIVLDDDIYIHYPLIWMFRDGVFPHVNPFFPDLLLKGHYARDLLLGGLARLTQLLPEHVILVFGLLASALNFVLTYLFFRQVLRKPVAAFILTSFLYFCLSAGHSGFLLRSGLVEATHNNNPFVILWCLVILFQLNRFYRLGRWPDAVASGVLLGALGFVYEVYLPFIALGVAVSFIAGAKRLVRFKWIVPKLAVMAVFMVLWAFTQGGVFSDLASRVIHTDEKKAVQTAQTDSVGQELSGATQQVHLHFPKRPFLSWTDPNGKSISIFSWNFLKDQGAPIFFVLPLLIFFVLKKNPLGAGLAAAGFGTILLTSMISFGRFDPDTYRLLFFSALAAGGAYALGFFMGIQFLTRRMKQALIISLSVSVFFLGIHAGIFIPKLRYQLNLGLKSPSIHSVNPADHLSNIMQFPLMSETDREAMSWLRQRKKSGRILTNYPFVSDGPQFNNSRLALSSWAGLSAAGFGLGIPERESFSLQVFVYGQGFRSVAYWFSGAPELLKSMKVKWLYLFPENPRANNLNEWKKKPGLETEMRFLDFGNGERLLLRVRPFEFPGWGKSRISTLKVLDFPDSWKKAEYREVPVQFSPPLADPMTLRQLLISSSGNRSVNSGDELVQVFDAGTQKANLRLVAPYFSGQYQVRFQILTQDGNWKNLDSNSVILKVIE